MPFKDPKEAQRRVRDVRLWWERDPDGPIIPRTLPPAGLRTPEGFVWGHKLEHLFWIQRIPGVNAMTIWSRSMLKEFGEGYDENEWDEPLVEPRVLRPWPVLKLIDEDASSVHPPLGAIDGGCECEHAEQVSYQIRRADEPSEQRIAEGSDGSSGVQIDVSHPAGPQVAEGIVNAEDEDVQMLDASVDRHESQATQPMSERAEPEPSKEEPQHPGAEDQVDGNKKTPAGQTEPQSQDADKATLGRSPFSVEGLPKLEEFIPDEFFPDVLMVHDPDNTTNKLKNDVNKPIKYIRCFPTFKRDDGDGETGYCETRVAHLHLSKSNRFGAGNHSYVYRAPLTLPPPLSAHSPTGQVTVAAKLAYARCTAHNLLRNEARVYDSFPKNIQQEYCGYNIVPQCRFPVPATAIVPKFFGYYLPVDERGDVRDHHHDKCSEEEPCDVDWPSPILLMEECGNPVEPSKFTIDQRTECFSLILRLHYLEIVQGSFYVRNIMIQPGPLTAPPEKRSYDTPSFRIIDFGRGKSWDWHIEEANRLGYWQRNRSELRDDFLSRVGDEIHRARRELLIDDFGF